MMTNSEMMKKMVKEYGSDAVMEMVRLIEKEIKADEAKYTRILSLYDYAGAGRTGYEFPDWVNETLGKVATEVGVAIKTRGDGNTANLAITHANFARYIVYTCNDDGQTLRDVIDILTAAPAWCKGRGLTRMRMELVFHILVLHRGQRERVKEELVKLLNKYDQTSLKVFANADDQYRYVLKHEIQMIAYAERYVCNAINEPTRFEYAA